MKETQEVILDTIAVLCRMYPEQRFGQIVYNYILTHCPNEDPFYIEDDKLLDILKKEVEKVKK